MRPPTLYNRQRLTTWSSFRSKKPLKLYQIFNNHPSRSIHKNISARFKNPHAIFKATPINFYVFISPHCLRGQLSIQYSSRNEISLNLYHINNNHPECKVDFGILQDISRNPHAIPKTIQITDLPLYSCRVKWKIQNIIINAHTVLKSHFVPTQYSTSTRKPLQ